MSLYKKHGKKEVACKKSARVPVRHGRSTPRAHTKQLGHVKRTHK